jgi:hypothetical protein
MARVEVKSEMLVQVYGDNAIVTDLLKVFLGYASVNTFLRLRNSRVAPRLLPRNAEVDMFLIARRQL